MFSNLHLEVFSEYLRAFFISSFIIQRTNQAIMSEKEIISALKYVSRMKPEFMLSEMRNYTKSEMSTEEIYNIANSSFFDLGLDIIPAGDDYKVIRAPKGYIELSDREEQINEAFFRSAGVARKLERLIEQYIEKKTGKSWDDIYKLMHSNAVLFGFGSFDQTEMHNLYFGGREGEALHNAGFYANRTVDSYLTAAMAAPTENAAIPFWQKAQWDGTTGFSTRGDAAWAWLVNLDHTYFVSKHLDIGHTRTEQHGSYIIANLPHWQWRIPARSEESGT